MNMNLDNEEDNRESSLQVNNYFMVEFVAIPPDFDISNYLTLREHTGIFKSKSVNLTNIKKIAEAIKHSPVLSLMNNALLKPEDGMYLLTILNDLGLILKSIPNPLRMSGHDIKRFIDHYHDNQQNDRWTYLRGQDIKRLNIIIVNIFPMMNNDVINEAMSIAQKLQQYQTEIEKKSESIGSLT